MVVTRSQKRKLEAQSSNTNRRSKRHKKGQTDNQSNDDTTDNPSINQSQKRKLESNTACRPKKRRKTDDPSDIDAMTTQNNIPNRRRSRRIQQKRIQIGAMTQLRKGFNESVKITIESQNKPIPANNKSPLQTSKMDDCYQPINSAYLLQKRELGQLRQSAFIRHFQQNQLNEFWTKLKTPKSMKLQSINPVFANDKIQSFGLHKSELFAFSGTKSGDFALSNFSQFPFENIIIPLHHGRITDIRCCETRPLKVYTSSFDGTVKIIDLTRNPYTADNAIDMHHNSTLFHACDVTNSGNEIFASDGAGFLHHCDIRTNQKHTNMYKLTKNKIATIRVHPLYQNYFIVTSRDKKSLQLWDMRYIKNIKKSDCVHMKCFKNVQNAINFSNDGSKLLVCGRDDYIRIYNNPLSKFDKDSNIIKHYHNNNTGIWITDFKPVFHPKYSEIISTGNLKSKGLEVIYCNDRKRSSKSKNIRDRSQINSVHSFAEFHSKFTDYLFGVTYGKVVFYAPFPIN